MNMLSIRPRSSRNSPAHNAGPMHHHKFSQPGTSVRQKAICRRDNPLGGEPQMSLSQEGPKQRQLGHLSEMPRGAKDSPCVDLLRDALMR